jgi:aminopeptidase N
MKSYEGKLDDSLARGLIWASLWDSTRDGELSASDYIKIALNTLKGETDISMITATFMQIDTAIWAYLAPENRDAMRLAVANAAEAFLDAAKPGSDHQLQFAKAFADAAVTPEQNERIKSILGGSVAGLAIDADLRWYLFICAIKRGVLGASDIDAELARDNTAHGKQKAAYAFAAIPTAESKAKAFTSVVNENLSNTIHAYTCRGFNLPLHSHLLEPFVDQYFAMLNDLWKNKGFEIAEATAILTFPTFVISDSTLAKAQNWLDVTGKDSAGALRRVVAEGRDALARALKAQKCDK